jgi:serine/threonine protein kinase
MEIACPSCAHAIRLHRPEPGSFGLKCPRCSTPLKLTVPEDPEQPPVLKARRSAAETPPLAAAGGSEATPVGEAAREPASDRHGASAEASVGEETVAVAPGPAPPIPSDPDGVPGVEADLTAAIPRMPPHPSDGLGETVAVTAATMSPPDGLGPVGASETVAATEALAATAVQTPTPAAQPIGPLEEIPEVLGGYRVMARLGRGGMGSVYRARQLSLDRDVALKVMAHHLASDPTFVARFCREAYAAAQLIHPNVVQIYDFGQQDGLHYFSMEFVDGRTLGELLRERGRLDAEVTAGYVLQAARGLKLAHDRGMIHRDIKPENLLLDRHDMVKVADLGLVKSIPAGDGPPGESAPAGDEADEGPAAGGPSRRADRDSLTAQITRADSVMGSPAYMAPEQARDADHIDQRADIYALGCTLYTLVTGRPPFEGKTVRELITRHASEPIVPPRQIVAGIPEALSAIILKMVAKQPDRRFANLDEVIAALEEFLGLARAEPLAGCPEEVALLDQGIGALGGASSARIRTLALRVLFVLCGAGVALALLTDHPRLAGAVLGLGLLTPICYVVIGEVARRSPLWLRARQYAVESGRGERIAAGAGALVLAAVLMMQGILWETLAMILGATALAGVARLLIERPGGRGEPVEQLQGLLRELRRRGFDEEAIRRSVAERAGPRWEAVRDALFGPEERLAAWRTRGRAGWDRARSGLAAWRDAALAWFEARLRARQEDRVRRHLERVEEESLRAQGLDLAAARRKARRAAEAIVAQAAELRRAGLRASRALTATFSSQEQRQQVIRSLHEAAERPEQILRSLERGLLKRRSAESLNALLGPRARFVAGIVLALAFLVWAIQNGWRSPDEPRAPLWLPLVPAALTGFVRDGTAALVGAILMASALVPGWRMGLLMLPASALALIGPTFGLPSWLCLPVAIALMALGFVRGW